MTPLNLVERNADMPTGDPICIVIDADIAHAAGGEDAAHLTSQRCRDTLKTVRVAGHNLTMTPEIIREWNDHQSGFARLWRVQMESEDRICSPNVVTDIALLNKIEHTAADAGVLRALRKDFHLIEAALATNKTVISLEHRARLHFRNACHAVEEICTVVWVNPNILEEDCLTWLTNGAEPEEQRQLGFSAA